MTKLKQMDNNLDRVDNVDIVDCIDIVVDVGDNFKHCRANMKQYQALFDEISKTSLTDWLSNIMDQKDASISKKSLPSQSPAGSPPLDGISGSRSFCLSDTHRTLP